MHNWTFSFIFPHHKYLIMHNSCVISSMTSTKSTITILAIMLILFISPYTSHANYQVSETSISEQLHQQQEHEHHQQQQPNQYQEQQQQEITSYSLSSSSASSLSSSQDKPEQIQTPKDQIPLVRLPSNTLLKYTAYKDVSILHFRIPTDTRTALFTFKAYEESKSAFSRVCQPRDITLHLKAGSYPVISPENITFPKNFLSADQRFQIYKLQFKSNSRTQRLTINGPQSGNWFAVAYISWTDPNNERIEQQGLAASCETLLLSEMSVSRITPILLNNGQLQANTLINDLNNGTREIIYKFYIPRNVGIITTRLTINNVCLACPNIEFSIQANALPSQDNFINSTLISSNQIGGISFDFNVHPSAWHYIIIKFDETDQKYQINDSNTDDSNTIRNHEDTNFHNNNNNGTWNELDLAIEINYHYEDEQESCDISAEYPYMFHNIEYYPLLRQTYREFFMFDYDLIPDSNGTVPTVLNITASIPVGFRFDVGDVYDIGGTLSFALSMKQDIKGNDIMSPISADRSTSGSSDNKGILAEKLIDKVPNDDEYEMLTEKTNGNSNSNNGINHSNQTIIICMRLGEPGEPKWPDKCQYGSKILPAASIINNTNAETSTGLIHVPFPESGQWYITMGLFCHGAETAARITIIDSVKEFIAKYSKYLDNMKSPPCSCTKNFTTYYKKCIENRQCLLQMNETETLKIKECLMDSKCLMNYHEMTKQFEIHHKYATEQSVAIDNCNSSVIFTISSSPCVAGRCGRYGRCYHYMSGGFVFSTCLCIKGYRGWDCTDDSQVPSSFSILISSLLLTLSNLLFIPSIYFAIKRKYLTESIIYFFAMFFSIFYHACDSGEDEYSFCLVKISVLQFCDFYCGLLAIWVTLIAMAHIRQQFVSILHMFGAIILAFGTELNKQSLWVFLAPALTGICIISTSWGLKCHKTRKWFPSRKYLTIYMPIGSILVMIGLICFAFLQTKQNYHIVHSIWHMVMALSLLCLLPSRNSFIPKC